MKKLIAKAILFIVCFQFAWVTRAQYATEFYLTDLDNAPLKEKVQQAIGKLLTEINTAQANNSQPYFSGLNISKDAQNTIMMLWDNTPVSMWRDGSHRALPKEWQGISGS